MTEQINTSGTFFIRFQEAVDHIALPERFTFPFYYEPHPLSRIAAKELQQHLENQDEWEHNFGLDPLQTGMVIGKMFGVLVVQQPSGELGYLAAFSGKLAGKNHHNLFVPPVFDILTEDGFFRKEEELLNRMNREIETLENSEELNQIRQKLLHKKHYWEKEISEHKAYIKSAKKQRDNLRLSAQLSATENLNAQLAEESRQEQLKLKFLNRKSKEQIGLLEAEMQILVSAIEQKKEQRRAMSAALQQQLFDQYYFLNAEGKQKSLGEIFAQTEALRPPAGAGECAAPKLLQYAFMHQLKPIAMAEFWWGQSPRSEVRVHKHFYPACKGKCEPILTHMLSGLETDPNPMLQNPAQGKEIALVYEDEYFAVINKPAEFLSVPGKNVYDSVLARVKLMYPQADGPLVVHRLDMSTSGIMLIAKTFDVYKNLQSQFIKRQIEKRYVALLDGEVEGDSGSISLPLRVDLDDRPRQLVCYEYGKPAHTDWELIERKNGKSKIYFYPKTGRTHQLRVHAAHVMGLNCPIVGDDLYGNPAERLHLHAEYIKFRHPETGNWMEIQAETEF